MKIKIKKIIMNNQLGSGLYNFADSEKNKFIIFGMNGTGKTPMFQLLSYALSNRAARERYFSQMEIDVKNVKTFKEEKLLVTYDIEHHGIKLDMTVSVKVDINNKKLYLSAWCGNQKVVNNSSSSTILSKFFKKKFSYPEKTLWINTIRRINFYEVQNFYMWSTLSKTTGEYYFQSKPESAHKNTFISSLVFLINSEETSKMNVLMERFTDVDRIRKKIQASQMLVNALVDTETDSVKLSTITNEIFNDIEKATEKLLALNSEKVKLNGAFRKVTSHEREVSHAESYNRNFNGSIDLIKFKTIITAESKFSKLTTIELVTRIDSLDGEIQELKKLISVKNEELKSIPKWGDQIFNVVKNQVEANIKSKSFDNQEIVDKETDDFLEVALKWKGVYQKALADLNASLALKFTGVNFKRTSIKIPAGSGFLSQHAQIKLAIALNKYVNSKGNELPFIMDSVFEVHNDSEASNNEIISSIIDASNQTILFMTSDEIKSIDTNAFSKFNSPADNKAHKLTEKEKYYLQN